ncbi:hypothetical protein D3C87_129750 [compost metagenome]
MINRINKWWKESMEWKERFEKLFPPSFLQSRAFKKAELKKLHKITSYPKSKLNEDEKLSQKMLYEQQYKELEKSLYPNPLLRLLRNTGRLAFNTLKWSLGKITGVAPIRNPNPVKNNSTIPASENEIRQFLKKSLPNTQGLKKKTEKTKTAEQNLNQKTSPSRQKKPTVIVPFKAGKTVRKGI